MRIYLSILLNLLLITYLKSSELDSLIKVDSIRYFNYIINKINIKGNKVTNDEVILRELNFKPGDKFDSTLYEQDKNNLNNLDIFNKVEINLFPDDKTKKIDYIILIEEAPNILPIPQGGMKEGSLKKIWAGINFKWKNFRGYNETVGLNFGVGYEPFISVSYYNPWIGNEERFFTSFNFTFSKFVKKVFPDSTGSLNKDNASDYNLFRYSTELSFGKYLSKYTKLFTSVSYNFNNVSISPLINYPVTGDNYSKLSLSFNFDKRNDNNYTTHGTYIDLTYNRVGIFYEKIQFNKIELNLKKFIPIRIKNDYFVSYSFWIRTANILGNRPPDYLLEVYGYDIYVRGWKDYLFKGENSFGFFSELRIPVIKPFYVDGKNHFIIKSIPFFKNFSYKYGFYITAFFDTGTIYNRSTKISDLIFKKGYGLGINVLLPFNFIVRIDFALNSEIEKFKSRFSFDLDPFF